MNQTIAGVSGLLLRWRRTPVRRYAAAMLLFLAFSTRLLAAADDDNPWAKISKRLVIGNVTLQLTNLEVHVTGSKVNETLSWEKPGIGVYFCAVQNPFAQPKMEDGYFLNDTNYDVLGDYDDFKVSAFRRFCFFTNRPTTIGLLTGFAGADGGNHQKLLLVDVETGAHLRFALNEGCLPQWLEPTQFPVAFVTRRCSSERGWHRPCVGQAYRFANGRYERDLVTEQRLLAQEFRKTGFTAEQREELDTANAWKLDDGGAPEETAQALGDFVYYATLTGHHAAVDQFLPTLKLGLHDVLGDLRTQIYAESRTNEVMGTVAPAPVPLGDGIQPPRFESLEYIVHEGDTLSSIAKRFGVTVKTLLNNNPSVNPKRLHVGQKVFIYEKQEIHYR